MSFGEIIWRTIVAFTVLFVLTRIFGKKQLSQLTFFNYITGITIGSTAASVTIDNSISFLEGLTSLVGWSLLTFLVGFAAMKWDKARAVVDGEPTIVIKKGEIDDRAVRRMRLNLDDLTMMLREKNCFSVVDVEYAILESNGKLSVMKKADREFVTRRDLKLAAQEPRFIPTEVIVDGKIIRRNLAELNLSKIWVEEELKKAGVQKIEDVFYAEVQPDGRLHIDLRDHRFH